MCWSNFCSGHLTLVSIEWCTAPQPFFEASVVVTVSGVGKRTGLPFTLGVYHQSSYCLELWDSDARESYNPGLSAVLLLDPSVNGGNEVVHAKLLGVRTPVVL